MTASTQSNVNLSSLCSKMQQLKWVKSVGSRTILDIQLKSSKKTRQARKTLHLAAAAHQMNQVENAWLHLFIVLPQTRWLTSTTRANTRILTSMTQEFFQLSKLEALKVDSVLLSFQTILTQPTWMLCGNSTFSQNDTTSFTCRWASLVVNTLLLLSTTILQVALSNAAVVFGTLLHFTEEMAVTCHWKDNELIQKYPSLHHQPRNISICTLQLFINTSGQQCFRCLIISTSCSIMIAHSRRGKSTERSLMKSMMDRKE